MHESSVVALPGPAAPVDPAALGKPGVPTRRELVLRGSARQVSAHVAELRAQLEAQLVESPDDYAALVLLGEINLRIGLNCSARDLLYRASLLKPPSWSAYQRTTLLLRRAEVGQSREVERVAGAPPPAFLRTMIAVLVRSSRRLLTTGRRRLADLPR